MAIRYPVFSLLLLLFSTPLMAAKIAVASNFNHAMKALATAYESQSNQEIELIFGATGKLYAQIRHGAPFDAFFSADVKRPALLEKAGKIQPGSRLTYATGRLVLWSPKAGLVDHQGQVLRNGNFKHLAIANPKLAPYGLAAQQVLQKMQLWRTLLPRLVRGENIAQTFQFVSTGNAELGLVAWSQLQHVGDGLSGSWWLLPADWHAPIEQQAVLLTDNPVAADFYRYLQTPAAKQLIRRYGYE